MLIAYTRSSSIFDDSRATKEILAFLDNGYQVVVYGWDRDGNALENCQGLFSEYGRAASFSFYSGDIGSGVKGKIYARYKWNKWLQSALMQNDKINVIHACDYDTGAVVRKVVKHKGISYVYDIFDYYVDAHPVPKVIKSIVEKDEIRVINESDTTIICTEERIEQIRESNPQKLVIIHNSPEVQDCGDEIPIYDYAYCGSLFGGRLIKEIIERYKDNNDLSFVFAGNGEFAGIIGTLAQNESAFTYLGPITYNEVLHTEMKARVISAIYDPSNRNHRLCAPNKFYEALALGKPIIVCRGTGIDKVVDDNDIGVVIGYDADEFYEAVRYLKENEDLCKEMGERARSIYKEKFMWSIMKKRLIGIYEQLA